MLNINAEEARRLSRHKEREEITDNISIKIREECVRGKDKAFFGVPNEDYEFIRFNLTALGFVVEKSGGTVDKTTFVINW